MTNTNDIDDFKAAFSTTALEASSVKMRQAPAKGGPPIQGILSHPETPAAVDTDAALHAFVCEHGAECVVVGHGYPDDETGIFVWRGTPEEFCENWIGDW